MEKPNEEGLPVPAGEENHDLISSLPLELGMSPMRLRMYRGLWIAEFLMAAVLNAERHFKARHTDIFLTSYPKSGTTWLKALVFATITRTQHSSFGDNHPLHSLNPHECIPFLEMPDRSLERLSELDAVSKAARFISSHLPFHMLPDSVKTSGCRLVYICRDPKDVVVSRFHFNAQMRDKAAATVKAAPLTSIFEMFCEGICPYGPIWDHALGYWKESLQAPERVLFLKYEDMLEDPIRNLTRLAEFMGCPFTEEETTLRVPEEILSLCSFDNLRGMAVKQNHIIGPSQALKTESFYRKGEVGDWRNHLSLEMAQKLDQITSEKLQGAGLTLGISSSNITDMDA